MSTIGFKDPAPAVEEPVDSTELVQSEEQVPATTEGFEQATSDARYIQFDRLAIVNKVGKLSDIFPKNTGEWVVDQSDLWGDEPLRVVVLAAPHWLEEDLDFDDNDMPRRFRTLGEARKAGFSHVDDGPGEHQVVDVANLFLLVQHEDGDLEAPDDTSWAVVQLTVRKGGFKSTWVKWNTQRGTGRLRDAKGGTIAGFWDLRIVQKAYNGNSWYAPELKKPPAKESTTSDEFRSWIIENFGDLTGTK